MAFSALDPELLADSHLQREQLEDLAEVYAILVTVENLEKLYMRDAIKPSEYYEECCKLIAQFKTVMKTVHDVVPDIKAFAAKYNLQCKLALHRLVETGVPATIEHAIQQNDSASMKKAIADVVHLFITVMDQVKLGACAVDELFPYIKDLHTCIEKLQCGDSIKSKVKHWYQLLSNMKASDKLSEEQSRQLLMEFDGAHNDFYRSL